MNKNNQQKRDLEFSRKILEWAISDETDLEILTGLRWQFVNVMEYRKAKVEIQGGIDKMLNEIKERTNSDE